MRSAGHASSGPGRDIVRSTGNGRVEVDRMRAFLARALTRARQWLPAVALIATALAEVAGRRW